MPSNVAAIAPVIGPDYYWLDLGQKRELVSSAAIGGGVSQKRWIFSRSVVRNWPHRDPLKDTLAYAERLGLVGDQTLGLITAVFAKNLRRASALSHEWQVDVYATVGVGNATLAGDDNPPPAYAAGTINIIALVYGHLFPEGLIGAVQTATEAKTRALLEAGVKNAAGKAATGTSTDTVTVVNMAESPTSPFAGPASAAGIAIGRAVYQVVTAGLRL